LSTALQFVSYRSAVLNEAPIPSDGGQVRPVPLPSEFTFIFDVSLLNPDGTLEPTTFLALHTVKLSGVAPPDQAALVVPMHPKHLPPGLPQNDARYAIFDFTQVRPVEGGKKFIVKLDGMRIRNVVFIGGNFFYAGDPIDLENVYFVNCTFFNPRDLKQPILRPDQVEHFAERLSESSSVTFHTS
jgi:hypothetical protein